MATPLAPARTAVKWDPDAQRFVKRHVPAVRDQLIDSFREWERVFQALLARLGSYFAAVQRSQPEQAWERHPVNAERRRRTLDQRTSGQPPGIALLSLCAAPNAPGY